MTVLKYLADDGVTWVPFIGDVKAPTASFVQKERPVGLVNGVNDTFTVTQAYQPGSLMGYKNGVAEGLFVIESSPSTGQFKFDVAPETGDDIFVSYFINAVSVGNTDTVDNFHANATATPNTLLPLNSSGKFPASAMAAPTPWVTATLGTGWTGFDTGPIPTSASADSWRYPRYHRDALGYVHLSGLAVNNSGGTNNGSTNTVVLTLPAGFRPGHSLLLITMVADQWCRVDVKVDGTVRLNGSVANGGWLSTSPITFMAEQ